VSALTSVNQAADLLRATADDVIDAAGLTLGELEHAAAQAGYCTTCYRMVPVLTDSDLRTIAARLSQ
jgi:hypothetical protein